MRYDEATTYLDFVRLPWADVVSHYGTPNNHVFHTLLAKAAVSVFGDAPWALRLPAFIAGVLIVPTTYAVARAAYGGRIALVAAAFVATAGMLVLYSANARGYTLVLLAFLLLFRLAMRILETEGNGRWGSFVVIGALGVWTTPAMLFPLGAVALWILFNALAGERKLLAKQVVIAMTAVVALALALYVPVMLREGMAAIIANPFLAPAGWFEFFQTLPTSLANAILSWSLGVPMLSVALVVLALLSLRRSASRFRVGFGLAAFVWCSWLLLVTHHAPPSRVWLWLVPVVATRAAVEIIAVLEGRERTRPLVDTRIGRSTAVFAAICGIALVTTRAVPASKETGSFRDARDVARELGPNLLASDVVLAAPPSNAPLSYYFRRVGITPPAATLDSARRVFVIVDVAEGQTLDRLTEGSLVLDTTRFTLPRVVGTFTTSGIFLYLRHGTSR